MQTTRILSGRYGARMLSAAVEIRQCIKIGERVLPKKSPCTCSDFYEEILLRFWSDNLLAKSSV
jgi:hypothetical protein